MRHSRKLRRGALASNTFRIVVRDLKGDPAELTERLTRITCLLYTSQAILLQRLARLIAALDDVFDRQWP